MSPTLHVVFCPVYVFPAFMSFLLWLAFLFLLAYLLLLVPAVAVFLSAIVSSLGFLLPRVSAMASVPTVSSVTHASNASRLY